MTNNWKSLQVNVNSIEETEITTPIHVWSITERNRNRVGDMSQNKREK